MDKSFVDGYSFICHHLDIVVDLKNIGVGSNAEHQRRSLIDGDE